MRTCCCRPGCTYFQVDKLSASTKPKFEHFPEPSTGALNFFGERLRSFASLGTALQQRGFVRGRSAGYGGRGGEEFGGRGRTGRGFGRGRGRGALSSGFCLTGFMSSCSFDLECKPFHVGCVSCWQAATHMQEAWRQTQAGRRWAPTLWPSRCARSCSSAPMQSRPSWIPSPRRRSAAVYRGYQPSRLHCRHWRFLRKQIPFPLQAREGYR